MSVEAITWALSLKVDRSSAKFVLVAMANCANNDMTCWPSVKYLSDATCQDRKTVLDNIKRLKDAGLIVDTNTRKGVTGSVPVYLLCSTENGTSMQSQKRDISKSEAVPKTEASSPVFPVKQSRFSAEAVPKTGHGTVIEPSMEPSGKRHKAPAPEIELPDWVPLDAWNGFLAMRKAIKKAVTADGLPLALKKLNALRLAGQDPRAVLEQSTMNNYQGLFEVKGSNQGRAPPGRQADVDEINRQAKEALFGKKKECIDV